MSNYTADLRLARADSSLANRARRAVHLCYHSVHPAGPPFLSVTPTAFAGQLGALRARGFRAGGREDLEAMLAGRPARERVAFLTFDDGYLDNHTTAWPILREHGLRGIVFALPDYVGAPALDWPEVAAQRAAHPDVMRPMTWAMLEELVADGMTVGSHTRRHAHLLALGDEELCQDLLDSRRTLAERLGRCDLLAYPFGEWDLRVALAAAAAGYRFGFSLPPGRRSTATPLSIPRLSVDHRERPARFALKLEPPVRALIFTEAMHRLRQLKIRARRSRQFRSR